MLPLLKGEGLFLPLLFRFSIRFTIFDVALTKCAVVNKMWVGDYLRPRNITSGGGYMKIVVVRSPKALSKLLARVFGVDRKE